MRIAITLLAICIAISGFSQDTTLVKKDTTPNILPSVPEEPKAKDEKHRAYVFMGQKAVNTNTVQLVEPGKLEFRVAHNFDDFAGKFGGLKNFFGLDNAVDIRIGFQYGISKRLNIVAARFKGDGRIQRLYEVGLKWLALEQIENDPSHPVALAFYTNGVVATMHTGTNPALENFVHGLSERYSYMAQAIIGRKFSTGFSFQLNPTFVHTGKVLPYDKNNMFALAGAARIHLGGRYNLLLDYSHSFRSKAVIDSFKVRNTRFYDSFGFAFEINTWGHIFQIHFSNATDLLENKLITHTNDTWSKGQFRWGFSIARNFDLTYKKRAKKKK
jgi:hypothetical protein